MATAIPTVYSTKPPNRVEEIKARNKAILSELRQNARDFVEWLEPLIGHGAATTDLVVLETSSGTLKPERIYKVYLYTRDYRYAIVFKPGLYLGCQVSGRTPKAGYEFAGGHDLSDGEPNIATWNQILADIIKQEIIPLGN